MSGELVRRGEGHSDLGRSDREAVDQERCRVVVRQPEHLVQHDAGVEDRVAEGEQQRHRLLAGQVEHVDDHLGELERIQAGSREHVDGLEVAALDGHGSVVEGDHDRADRVGRRLGDVVAEVDEGGSGDQGGITDPRRCDQIAVDQPVHDLRSELGDDVLQAHAERCACDGAGDGAGAGGDRQAAEREADVDGQPDGRTHALLDRPVEAVLDRDVGLQRDTDNGEAEADALQDLGLLRCFGDLRGTAGGGGGFGDVAEDLGRHLQGDCRRVDDDPGGEGRCDLEPQLGVVDIVGRLRRLAGEDGRRRDRPAGRVGPDGRLVADEGVGRLDRHANRGDGGLALGEPSGVRVVLPGPHVVEAADSVQLLGVEQQVHVAGAGTDPDHLAVGGVAVRCHQCARRIGHGVGAADRVEVEEQHVVTGLLRDRTFAVDVRRGDPAGRLLRELRQGAEPAPGVRRQRPVTGSADAVPIAVVAVGDGLPARAHGDEASGCVVGVRRRGLAAAAARGHRAAAVVRPRRAGRVGHDLVGRAVRPPTVVSRGAVPDRVVAQVGRRRGDRRPGNWRIGEHCLRRHTGGRPGRQTDHWRGRHVGDGREPDLEHLCVGARLHGRARTGQAAARLVGVAVLHGLTEGAAAL